MRIKLSPRRASETRKIQFAYENGKEQGILITVGFDEGGEPKEVFCADFKAGTTLHSIVMDACILFSRLLQHGDLPVELFASMCRPPSLIGAIAATIAEYQRSRPTEEGDQVPTSSPWPNAPAGEAVAAMEGV
jgi:hypothetical protein